MSAQSGGDGSVFLSRVLSPGLESKVQQQQRHSVQPKALILLWQNLAALAVQKSHRGRCFTSAVTLVSGSEG